MSTPSTSSTPDAATADALDVPIARLDGTPGTLREIVGPNAALVVNVASRCGLTPQYGALERLQETYGDAGLTVVGVPCNQFGGQEPGTSEEIATFCSTRYGVTFPLTEKVDVNGTDRHPLYQRLVSTPDERGRTGDIAWNFEKFVLDRSGRVVARFSPPTTPDDPRLVAAVEAVVEAS
jgi:glutathione peroxidase